MSDRQEERAKDYAEERKKERDELGRKGVERPSPYVEALRGFKAGWNACWAEMTTKRSDPPAEDWFGKEQSRD